MEKRNTTLRRMLSAGLALSIFLSAGSVLPQAAAAELPSGYELVQQYASYRVVERDGKYGLFKGDELSLPCEYDAVSPCRYADGRFLTQKDGVYALYDPSEGKNLIETPHHLYELYFLIYVGFAGVHSMAVPYYCTKDGDTLTLWNEEGGPLVTDSTLRPTGFVTEGGYVPVQDTKTGLYGVWAAEKASLTVPCQYVSVQLVSMVSEGSEYAPPGAIALVPAEDGRKTVLGAASGKAVLPETCDSVSIYADCLAVTRDGQTRYYDTMNGEWVEPQSDLKFSEELSAWAKDEACKAEMAELVESSLQDSYTAPCTRRDFCHLIAAVARKRTGLSVQEMLVGRDIAESCFSDTADGVVLACADLGIVNGVGGGRFAPDRSIKREEAAAMLYRAAGVLGITANSGHTAFADASRISAYAKEAVAAVSAMQTADGVLVMQGTGNGNFSPAGVYTKEQSILTAYRLYRMA